MKTSPTPLFIIFCMLISTCVYSQNNISVTGRYGINTIGFTAAVPVSQLGSIEGMYTISHDKIRQLLTAFYAERYIIGDNTNLEWFAGVGLHAGYRRVERIVTETGDIKFRLAKPDQQTETEKQFIGGADAIIGITYKIPNIPIMIGLDMKPNVDFINAGSMMVDGGVSVGFSF